MNPTWFERQRARARALSWSMRSSATWICPESGESRPPIRLSSVVLPDPDGPIRAQNSPRSISRLKPCRTATASRPLRYFLTTSLTRTMASLMLFAPAGFSINDPGLVDAQGRALFDRPAGRIGDDPIPGREAGRNDDSATAAGAELHRASFRSTVVDPPDVVASVASEHRLDGHRRQASGTAGLCRSRTVCYVGFEEAHADAHLGQDARIALDEFHAHADRGLLAVSGRHDRLDPCRNFEVRIGVEGGYDRLPGRDPIDISLVDVDLDFEGVHVDDGADTGSGKAT